MIGAKPSNVRFNNIDGFVRIYDGNRYLILFWGEKKVFIYNKIRYLVEVKSGVAYVISQNYEKSLFIRFFPLAKKIDFSWCYNTY